MAIDKKTSNTQKLLVLEFIFLPLKCVEIVFVSSII